MAVHDTLALGPLRLFRTERLLSLHGRPLPLPAGAVELLLLLVGRPGQAVAAHELRQALGPLRQQAGWAPGPAGLPELPLLVEALNAALASGSARHFIAESAEVQGADQGADHGDVHGDGHGYTFHGEVSALPAPGAGAAAMEDERSLGQLPAAAPDLVRRDALVARGLERLRHARLATLLGPGGVGKTTLALVMAQACRAEFPDGVCFVDLSPIRQPGAVGRAVLLALGWAPGLAADGLPPLDQSLCELLAGRRLLVVLDNCEHVVDEAAAVAELLLRARQVHVLATSREPLKTFGEACVPVGPLELPPEGADPDWEQARHFAATALFLARAEQGGARPDQLARELDTVYEVCRRLDGIALALELAAAHVPRLGLRGLAQRLAHWPVQSLASLAPLASPVPQAPAPRHRTLEAAFDWSHALLAPREQAALRRLAVFRGAFPFESALRVISLEGQSQQCGQDPVSALFGLQAKSLLAVSVSQGAVHYRLLETTRDYALARLAEDDEQPQVRHQHALDSLARLQLAEREWARMNGTGWVARYGRLIEDVWQATEWCLGPGGDVAIGAELVLLGLPMASRLGRFEESIALLSRALAALTRPGAPAQPRLELQLLVAIRSMALNTTLRLEQLPGTDQRIRALVREIGDDRNVLGAHMCLWFTGMMRADYAQAAEAGEQQVALAPRSGRDVDQIDALKHAAYALHFVGNQARATDYARRALALTPGNLTPSYYNVAQCDVRVSMRIVLARVHWMAGQGEAAESVLREALALAREDRPLATCLVLSFVACPMALWNGDHAGARDHAAELADWAGRHRQKVHQSWAGWFGWLAGLEGRPVPAERPAHLAPPHPMEADMLSTLGCAWAVPETARRVDAGLVGWCAPEVLRMQGEALLRQGERAAARERFQAALQRARADGARAWEARAAASLARLDGGPVAAPASGAVIAAELSRLATATTATATATAIPAELR